MCDMCAREVLCYNGQLRVQFPYKSCHQNPTLKNFSFLEGSLKHLRIASFFEGEPNTYNQIKLHWTCWDN